MFLDNLQFGQVADVATQCVSGATIAEVPADPTPEAPNAFHPEVEITSPRSGSAVGAEVTFEAKAFDVEDEDISGGVEWSSSKDGWLGTGASITKELSAGVHVITALSTDSGGLTRSDSISIDVVRADLVP